MSLSVFLHGWIGVTFTFTQAFVLLVVQHKTEEAFRWIIPAIWTEILQISFFTRVHTSAWEILCCKKFFFSTFCYLSYILDLHFFMPLTTVKQQHMNTKRLTEKNVKQFLKTTVKKSKVTHTHNPALGNQDVESRLFRQTAMWGRLPLLSSQT